MAILVGKKYSFGSRYFEGFAPSIYVDPRYYWKFNGASYGVIPSAIIGIGGTFAETLYLSALPTSTVNIFTTTDETSYLTVDSSGVIAVVGDVTATLNGVAIVSGVTAMSAQTVSIIEITATAEIAATNIPATASLPSAYIYDIKVTGITNTDVYPSGSAYYKLDEPWSDDHIAVDSDNTSFTEHIDNDNPHSVGSQWTYLGEGRWQYIGDGSYNALELINPSLQPELILLSFDVEEISGELAVSQTVDYKVSTIGNYTVVLNKNEVSTQVFKRTSGSVSCIISSISIKQTTAMKKLNDVEADYSQELS